MGDKSAETLGIKIRFSSVFSTFFSLSTQTMLIFLFLRQRTPQNLHNIELGGRGYHPISNFRALIFLVLSTGPEED